MLQNGAMFCSGVTPPFITHRRRAAEETLCESGHALLDRHGLGIDLALSAAGGCSAAKETRETSSRTSRPAASTHTSHAFFSTLLGVASDDFHPVF